MCYCDGCRNGFRKATGLELPWHERDTEYTPEDVRVIDRYHAWQHENLVDLVHEVRKLVKSYKNIPLIYNINNPLKITQEDPRIYQSMDAFLYERGSSMLERAEGVSLAKAQGMGIWPYVGEYNNWPRVINNALDYQQQIFATAMFGGGTILAQPWGYVQHAEKRKFVEYSFRILQQHEADFAGFHNYPYVAVLYENNDPKIPAEKGWWWKTDQRSSSEGAFAACLYGHVQVSSIHERLLDEPEKLRGYQVLYLAGAAHLSPSRIANIKEFVRNGGGLVVSYTSSLYDEAGNRQKQFGLEELIHAAPIEPAGDLADTIANYRSITGGPYDLYLTDHTHPSSHGLTPLWSFQAVQVLNGGRVSMDVVTGDGLRPILPGVIVSSYGKGRVVYCASALEGLFLQNNDSAVGDQIKKLIAEAAATPAPYEVEGPAALIANLTKNGDSLMLHLTNWTGDKLERNGSKTYYLAPVENVRLRIRIPRGKRVRAVRLSVETPYKKAQTASVLELTFPRIEAYQGVRVDLE